MLDNIWFSYKARIQAHERLSGNDFHSQLILVWYAVVGVILSILTIRYPKVLGDDTDIYAACISAILMAVSLLVTNRDWRGRSIEMRRNYLDLQALYNSYRDAATLPSEAIQKYEEILRASENHTELDDKKFRVSHAATLKSRIPSKSELIMVYYYSFTRFAILTAIYAAPAAPVYFKY